jgi:hypothetical protein
MHMSLTRNKRACGVHVASSCTSPKESWESQVYTGSGKHMPTWDAATPKIVNTIRMDTDLTGLHTGKDSSCDTKRTNHVPKECSTVQHVTKRVAWDLASTQVLPHPRFPATPANIAEFEVNREITPTTRQNHFFENVLPTADVNGQNTAPNLIHQPSRRPV